MSNRAWMVTVPLEDMLINGWRSQRGVRYIVYQIERGEKTSYLHVQLYMELRKPQRLSWVKTSIGSSRAHCEPRMATREQARAYCMKEETRIAGPWEYGEWIVGQGHRSDIHDLYKATMDGVSLLDMAEQHTVPYFKYHRAVDKIRELKQREDAKRFRKVNITVILGEGGVGKTSLIYKLHGYENVYILERPTTYDNIWFDGYDEEKVLLIDDFYGWLPWGFLLRLLDGYPLRLSIKGGSGWAAFDKIYITSNQSPREWYSKGFPKELRRRINRGILRLEA